MTTDKTPRLDVGEDTAGVSVPTAGISSTPAMSPAKPKGVIGPKAGPAIYAGPRGPLSQSGYARREAAMKAAARTACTDAPTLPVYKDEPHEQDGFAD
jgi:hypothetical protein